MTLSERIFKSNNKIKTTWNIINELLGKQQSMQGIQRLTIDRTPLTNQQDIANEINEYFSSTTNPNRTMKIQLVCNMTTYALLDNLKEAPKTSHSHSHKVTNEITQKRNRNKKESLPTKKKKKIVIIGDSHARGFATKISSSLNNKFDVTGTVLPGARLGNITKLADCEIRGLGKSDVVIVMGGVNDINKNETII